MTDARTIRQAIIDALPLDTSNDGAAPDPRLVYIPPAHVKALHLECNLVVGARGVGKTFWTGALASKSLRTTLGQSVRELQNTDVSIGYSILGDLDAYPDKDTFARLINESFAPYDIWRAVIVRRIAKFLDKPIPSASWFDTTSWLKNNPEPLARLLQDTNQHLQSENRRCLIVFDALDRTGDDWGTMDGIVRDLLRTVLWLKSYPKLHTKVFLREDQFDRTIADFPDASKLLNTKTELNWAAHDLHGMLWQRLCNSANQSGNCLRNVYQNVVGALPTEEDGIWRLSEEVKRETIKQRALFEALAGPWMGRDRRRGVPYVWSVSHLADGRQRTSPRSFIAAIRAAAENSSEKYPEHAYALHYESIKNGVQEASKIRVENEIGEEYPWVPKAMRPLEGTVVPCEFALIEELWGKQYPSGPNSSTFQGIPPQTSENGWPGVRDYLERLGIFEKMKDDRVNLPDLYRVGFRLGRRGGVKPLK